MNASILAAFRASAVAHDNWPAGREVVTSGFPYATMSAYLNCNNAPLTLHDGIPDGKGKSADQHPIACVVLVAPPPCMRVGSDREFCLDGATDQVGVLRMIRRELSTFLVVGCSVTLIDFLVYHGLLWTGWLGTDLAKATGFIIGTVCSYFANKWWTFGRKRHKPGSAPRFFLLYSLTMGANVLVNGLALGWLAGMPAAIHIAFVLATGVSTVLNFLGIKLLVFNEAAGPESA